MSPSRWLTVALKSQSENNNMNQIEEMKIKEIADLAIKDWGEGINPYALNHLEQMKGIENISDDFFLGKEPAQIRGFLANAQAWVGDTADTVKAELRRRLKGLHRGILGVVL